MARTRIEIASAAGLAAALALGASAAEAEDITIGFVAHAQGDPFVQQIQDGAQAAANDLGVKLVVAQQAGGAPEGQLKLVQNFVNSGAQGIATSVPGESMAKGLNEIIASGVPVVQFNLLVDGRRSALCRRKIGRERPHPRPDGASTSSAATAPRARSSSAIASPAFRCSKTAPRGSRNR